jgi:hypothetical protein
VLPLYSCRCDSHEEGLPLGDTCVGFRSAADARYLNRPKWETYCCVQRVVSL